MDGLFGKVIDGAAVIPGEVVVIYAWTKLLPIRNERLFWVVCLALSCVFAFFRSSMGSEARLVTSIVFALYYFVAPFAFSKGKVASRILVCVAVYAVIMVAELMGSALWVAMTGTPIGDYDAVRAHFAAYWFMRAVHLLIMVTLLALLYRFVRLRRADKSEGTGLGLFIGFPAMQLLLLVSLVLLGTYLVRVVPNGASLGNVAFAAGAALSALCVVVDAFLFMSIDRHSRRMAEERHAQALQQQLEWRMAQYQDVVRDIEATARVRHDLKNQLQVVSLLVERGELSLAREHLRAMTELAEPQGQPAVPEPKGQPSPQGRGGTS